MRDHLMAEVLRSLHPFLLLHDLLAALGVLLRGVLLHGALLRPPRLLLHHADAATTHEKTLTLRYRSLAVVSALA